MANKIINNINDFQNFLLDKSNKNYNLEGKYILNCNINWKKIAVHLRRPIDIFYGSFDGKGFEIKNFSYEEDTNYIGLFSCLSNAIVKNLCLNMNGELKGNSYIGCLVGYTENSEISFCKINGKINLNSSGPNCGLLFGASKYSKINNVEIFLSDSTIRGVKTIGSFGGNCEKSDITNCKVTGKLDIIGSNSNSSDISGFVGFSSASKFNDCIVNFNGTIIASNNVSGFVSVEYLSEFKDCEMNIFGNITSFTNTNLFCSLSIEPKLSKFINCNIGINSQINGILINIFNVQGYSKIANTEFDVIVNKKYYSDEILNLLDLRSKIINEDGLIYMILDYILTVKQLSKLVISNFEIKSELEIINNLISKFKGLWINLSYHEKTLFSKIGFSEEKFNKVIFPDIKWNNLTKAQRYAALNLGFSKNLWDNKIIQTVSKKPHKIKNTGIRINFEIKIINMILKLPNYIRTIILIEIKQFLVKLYSECLPKFKELNLYFRNESNLDISIIFTNEIDLDDDVSDGNICVIEKVDKYILLNIDYNNYVFVNKYFRENEKAYTDFLKFLINELIKVNLTCEYTIDILDFNNNFKQIKAKVSLNESHSKIIDKNDDLNSLSSKDLINILKNFVPDNLVNYPNKINLNWDLYSNLNSLNDNFIDEIEYNDYAVCTNLDQLNKKVGYHTPFSNIVTSVLINNNYANDNDILLIYVNNELRGHGIVRLFNDVPIVNTKIFINKFNEVITFRVYNCDKKLLFDVPNFNVVGKPGENLGNLQNPIQIEAYGKTPPEVVCITKEDFGEPVKYFNNLVNVFGYIIINYKFAKKGDFVAAYVDGELRGLTEVYLYNNIPFVNLSINSSGKKETVNFSVLETSSKQLFTVPDFKLDIIPGKNYGDNLSPIKIRAIGKVFVELNDFLSYVDQNTLLNLSNSNNISTQTDCIQEEKSIEPNSSNNQIPDNEIPVDDISNLCEVTVDKKSFVNFIGLASLNNKKKMVQKPILSNKCGSGCGTSCSGV